MRVQRWSDYPDKYGMAYTLFNGSVGMVYNDTTKIVAFSEQFFYYAERVQNQEKIQKY